MADKTLRYKLLGSSVEQDPHSVTGKAIVRMGVRTKAGSYHTLLIEVDVHDARMMRSRFNAVCAKFKELAAQLYNSL